MVHKLRGSQKVKHSRTGRKKCLWQKQHGFTAHVIEAGNTLRWIAQRRSDVIQTHIDHHQDAVMGVLAVDIRNPGLPRGDDAVAAGHVQQKFTHRMKMDTQRST